MARSHTPPPRIQPRTVIPFPGDLGAVKGRAAHPAGADLIDPHEARPISSLSFGALREIAAGLARTQEPLHFIGESDGPRSSRLLATAFYDVWLITWPAGSGLESHDHGVTRSVVHVVKGELEEVVSDRRNQSEPTPRILREGSSTAAEATEVHSLANRSGADVTTLHVYSPPLSDVTFFDVHDGEAYEAVRFAHVGGRSAQGSSSESTASSAPALRIVRT